MVLALPVAHPRRPDTVLLRAGVALDDTHAQRLRELGVRDIWIQYPRLEFLADYVAPGVHEACAQLASELNSGFERFRGDAHANLDFGVFRRALAGLMEQLASNPKAALFIQETGLDDPLLRRASTVCFLSVLMGLKLDFYLVRERSRLRCDAARDVTSLGLGALVHDIGMLQLPQEVRERWFATHEENDEAWRRHVRLGFDMVKNEVEPAAAAVVLHHHQKFDGSGFPQKKRLDGKAEPLAGSDIHVFARIAAAAELFDRLRWPAGADRAAAPPVPTVRALRLLLEEPYRSWIDPVVRRGLTTVVPPYAPGTLVTLSNGVRGVVTSWTPEDPCRPRVMEVRDLEPRRACALKPAIFDLRQHHGLEVAQAEGADVLADNFYPAKSAPPGEFDATAYAKALNSGALV